MKSITETIPSLRRDEIFFAHFPDLKGLVRDHGAGRQAGSLVRLLDVGHGYLGGWAIRMRYEGNRSVTPEQVEAWKNDAQRAIGLMEAT